MGVLKDGYDILLGTWRAVRECQWSSIFQALAVQAKVWTVAEWYELPAAIEKLGDLVWARQRIKVRKKLGELEELDPRYVDAELQIEHRDDILLPGLNRRLRRGELIARGFREPLSPGAPYRPISWHEWRVMELKLPDRAEGGGIGYVGLTIGKPGTRRLFRRGR